MIDPDILDMESKLTEKLGTRVHIEKRDFGGKVTIDFFSKDDLRSLLDMVSKGKIIIPQNTTVAITETSAVSEAGAPVDDSTPDEVDDSELYSIKNFSL